MSELVTVVVPARNEEANLGPCLSSILEQDWPNLQVLVVDGASTDGTGAIVESFARRDPRVELLVNPDRTIPALRDIIAEAGVLYDRGVPVRLVKDKVLGGTVLAFGQVFELPA